MGRTLRRARIMLIGVVSLDVSFFIFFFFFLFSRGAFPFIVHLQKYPSAERLRNVSTGLSRTAIFEAVNASLARLQLDHLDLLQIHRFDPHTPIEETMLALHDLVRSGKVHYIGASSMWAWQFSLLQHAAEKNHWTKFVSMQNHYNLLYREEEREMNAFCNATGVGLIPWAPLSRGHLARPLEAFGSTTRSEGEKKSGAEQSEADREIVRRVQEVAEKKGWKMSHVALAWINKRISAPIIGFSSVERMDEALDACGKELSREEEEYLEEPYKPKAIVGHS